MLFGLFGGNKKKINPAGAIEEKITQSVVETSQKSPDKIVEKINSEKDLTLKKNSDPAEEYELQQGLNGCYDIATREDD